MNTVIKFFFFCRRNTIILSLLINFVGPKSLLSKGFENGAKGLSFSHLLQTNSPKRLDNWPISSHYTYSPVHVLHLLWGKKRKTVCNFLRMNNPVHVVSPWITKNNQNWREDIYRWRAVASISLFFYHLELESETSNIGYLELICMYI